MVKNKEKRKNEGNNNKVRLIHLSNHLWARESEFASLSLFPFFGNEKRPPSTFIHWLHKVYGKSTHHNIRTHTQSLIII